MKIYVVGHKNWISKRYISEFDENKIKYITSEFDESSNNLLSDILDQKVSHVIYCNGFQLKDEIFDEPLEESTKYNILAPVRLAIFCQRYKIHFTYIGTGNIYKYDKNASTLKSRKPFNEEDEPNNDESKFLILKSCTDRLIKTTDSLNLRLSHPLSSAINDPKNYLNKMLFATEVNNIPTSISVIDELIPLSVNMIRNKVIGTFNFVNPGVISENDILQMYKDIYDNNFSWKCKEKIKELEHKYYHLDTTLLELNQEVIPIKEAIKKVMEKMVLLRAKNHVALVV